MQFSEKFKLTKKSQNSNAILHDVFGLDIQCGQYNDGLLYILDDDYKNQLFYESNEGFKANEVIAISGFGNVFSYDLDLKRFYVFEVQGNQIYYVDLDGIDDFLNNFLTHEIIEDDYLKSDYFNEIISYHHFNLQLTEILILKPYKFLGGVDNVESYSKGDFSVFLDLVNQNISYDAVIDRS